MSEFVETAAASVPATESTQQVAMETEQSTTAIQTPSAEVEAAANPEQQQEQSEEQEQEGAEGSAVAGTGPSKRKKKKRNKKKKAAADEAAFHVWCTQALQDSSKQVDGLDAATLAGTPWQFQRYTGWSGPLRPQYVTAQVKVPDSIVPPDYHETGEPLSERAERRNSTVHVHTAEELQQFREVCVLGREVMETARRFLRAGVTGDEIDRIVHAKSVELGCYPSPLNYCNFPKSVCVSVNEVICHGIPDCRPVQDGDIVNLDVTVYKNGWHADLNETFIIGTPDESTLNVVRTAYECLTQAVAMVRPRTMYRDLGTVISKTAASTGCSVVKSYTGHGIGRLFHTAPTVPHYAKNKGVGIMRPGHVFTIEPMINAGANWGDILWPDNWTAVSKDGSNSAQFEHTMVVTENGVELMTARPGAPRDSMVWDEAYVMRPGSKK